MADKPVYVICPSSLQEIKNTILSEKPNWNKYYFFKQIEEYAAQAKTFFGEYRHFEDFLEKLNIANVNVPKIYFYNIKTPKTTIEDNDGFQLSNEGIAYDMGSVIEGNPECCIAPKGLNQKKYVKIKIHNFISARFNKEYIDNRAIAIANFVNNLVVKNYIVDLELFAEETFEEDWKEVCSTTFSMKIPTNIINIPRIAYILSTEFYRGILWLYGAIKVGNYNIDNGRNDITDFEEEFTKCAKNNEFFIKALNSDEDFSNFDSLEAANKAILESWNKFVEISGKE